MSNWLIGNSYIMPILRLHLQLTEISITNVMLSSYVWQHGFSIPLHDAKLTNSVGVGSNLIIWQLCQCIMTMESSAQVPAKPTLPYTSMPAMVMLLSALSLSITNPLPIDHTLSSSPLRFTTAYHSQQTNCKN